HALLGRAAADVAAVEGDLPLPRRQLADDGLHQRGLAGAVAAQHGDAATPGNAEVDVEQDLAAAIAGVEMLDVQKFRHGADRSPGRICWPGSRTRISLTVCFAWISDTVPDASTLPWSSTVRRSQMSRMKSRSCSTITSEQ